VVLSDRNISGYIIESFTVQRRVLGYKKTALEEEFLCGILKINKKM